MDFSFRKFLGKGYKVGRVDQAETALGAEMRLGKEKEKGKPAGKESEKIVRRYILRILPCDSDIYTSSGSSIKSTPTGPSWMAK
jgi:hypothetical protein